MLLEVSDVTKEYDGAPVITGVTFQVSERERLAIVGRNGCGKTTLLKILAGQLEPEIGTVRWHRNMRGVGYLPQAEQWLPDTRLADQVVDIPDSMLARCGIGTRLLSQAAGTLSGGERVRAALARALAGEPDALLLDEPTNHLDVEGMEWLEELLSSYPGTVIVVSHDRYFLDRVATRVLEIEDGKARGYPGNYSAYAAQKRAEMERQESQYRHYVQEKRRLMETMRRQTEWARSAVNAPLPDDAPKNARVYMNQSAEATMRRVRDIANRLERMKVEKPREARQVNLGFDGSAGVGKNLVLARDLGFSYDVRRWLFRRSSFYIQRGDAVGIIGPNGSGKTTLVEVILGHLSPSEGSVYCSPVKVAYLAQEAEGLNPELTILEEVSGSSGFDQPHVRSLLGSMLFSGEDVMKKISVLSAGERLRVALAKILLRQVNMLVLDEPTNGLDLASRERVEDALDSFEGTMILVSHDRYLLKRLATGILSIGKHGIEQFKGTYEEWVERRHRKPGAYAVPAGDRHTAGERPEDRILLLEMRLASISAPLQGAGGDDGLTAEFIEVSRELRALKDGIRKT